jgi:hypothetical protein
MDTMTENKDLLYSSWNKHYEKLNEKVPSIENYKNVKNCKKESKSRRVFATTQFFFSLYRAILLLFKDFNIFILDMFLIFAVGK